MGPGDWGRPWVGEQKEIKMPTIKIKRLSRPIGALRQTKIFLDNEQFGTIGNGEQKSFEVPAGSHAIYVKGTLKSNVVELNLTSEDVVFLVFSSKDSSIRQYIALISGVAIGQFLLHISTLIVFILFVLYLWKSNKLLVPLELKIEDQNDRNKVV